MRLIYRPLSLLAFLTISFSSASAFDAANATNQLGIDLLRQISATDTGNVLLSPYSLSGVLAPLYLGSAGDTRAELSRTLHFPDKNAPVEKAFSGLRSKLILSKSPASKSTESSQTGPILDSANRLFVQHGFPIREAYSTQLQTSFGFTPLSLDFRNEPEKSAATINDWASRQTRGKITSVLPAQGASPDTRLLLINALYFKADWQHPFDSSNTFPRPFHLNGSTQTTDRSAMKRTARMGYAHEAGFQIVSLPYADSDYHCLIILPDQLSTSLDSAQRITADQLKHWSRLARSSDTLVELQLPSFRFENAARSLATPLKALGIRSAFDEPLRSANFDPISPRSDKEYLALSDILQSTFVALDEDGTEAAAISTVELVTLGISSRSGPKPVEMHVDRPFLFAIQHAPTGTCLFVGRVADPQSN